MGKTARDLARETTLIEDAASQLAKLDAEAAKLDLLVGTADQITDNLKRYKEAGMDMPLLWPPFQGVEVSKTIDDMKRLVNDIMPKVNAI